MSETLQTTSPHIVLASQSAIRRALLENAGLNVACVPAFVDEEAAKHMMRDDRLSPRDQADKLAEIKALKVSQKAPGLVLGCDQMLALGTEAFDKCATMDDARARLQALAGKTHSLESAAVIAKDGQVLWRVVKTARLTMRPFSDDFLDAYLEQAGPEILSSVGCYMLEKHGVQLFSSISGDYFTILGLPLLEVLDYLRVQAVVKA